jgi:hypothetical protein
MIVNSMKCQKENSIPETKGMQTYYWQDFNFQICLETHIKINLELNYIIKKIPYKLTL